MCTETTDGILQGISEVSSVRKRCLSRGRIAVLLIFILVDLLNFLQAWVQSAARALLVVL